MGVKINHLQTENRNAKTMNLDQLSTREILEVMNQEDYNVPKAIGCSLDTIEQAVKAIIEAYNNGGRLIYLGAGTSGRLGVIDAAECKPTFGTTFEVEGILAGGLPAMLEAQEGAEDSEELAVSNLKEHSLSANDVLVGIAASGRTPYVIGGLKYAKQIGAKTVAVACNLGSEIGKIADIAIEVNAGPEVLTGSTRLKSGTCQKLILNMLSTASMVGYGKVYGNLMVDVLATNLKLVERSKRIIMEATGCNYDQASKKYEVSKNVKESIVMILCDCELDEAKNRIKNASGFVREAIK